jgi:hypothetical protein
VQAVRGDTDGIGSAARFHGSFGLTSDAEKTLYITDAGSRKIRMLSLETANVTTIAGNGNNTDIDGPGAAASFAFPTGLVYYARTNVLFVSGLSGSLRVVNLLSPVYEVSSIFLSGQTANFLMLTPDLNYMHMSDFNSHQIILFDIASQKTTVVAGARQQQGWEDGFGTAARFNQPEVVALVGESYGWPCLYINEDRGGQVSSLREVRLRDQYVRSIQLVGLRAGYDIETIIPYTDHFSGEIGLLMAGGDIYFAPLAQLPTESRTWSTPLTASRSISDSSSISFMRSSVSETATASSQRQSTTFTTQEVTPASLSESLSETSTASLSSSRCVCALSDVFIAAAVSSCHLCSSATVAIQLAPPPPDNSSESPLSGGRITFKSVSRATWVSTPLALLSFAVTLANGKCWVVRNITFMNKSLVFRVTTSLPAMPSLVELELLVEAPLGGWPLSSIGPYEASMVVLNIVVDCRQLPNDEIITASFFVTVPCPALSRPLESEVETGSRVAQWVSVASGSGASGSAGRVAALRSVQLCGVGGLSGLVTLPSHTCGGDSDTIDSLAGNLVVVLSAALMLLMLCLPLAMFRGERISMLSAAKGLAFPSSMFPVVLATMPTTAGLAVVAMRDGSRCTASMVVGLTGVVVCVSCIAATAAVHVWSTSHLELRKLAADDHPRWMVRKWRLVTAARHRWYPRHDAAFPNTQHKHAALLLHEYRVLWYCVVDAGALLVSGVLVGVASATGEAAICSGCGVAIALIYAVQLGLCVKIQPFNTLFAYIHQSLTLALSTVSAAVQAASLITSQHNQSKALLGTLQTLSYVSAVCDLVVVGLSVMRSAMDFTALLKHLWHLSVVLSSKQQQENAEDSKPSHALPALVQQLNPAGDDEDEGMLTHIMLASDSDCGEDVEATDDVDSMFWDVDGNAKVADAHDEVSLLSLAQ